MSAGQRVARQFVLIAGSSHCPARPWSNLLGGASNIVLAPADHAAPSCSSKLPAEARGWQTIARASRPNAPSTPRVALDSRIPPGSAPDLVDRATWRLAPSSWNGCRLPWRDWKSELLDGTANPADRDQCVVRHACHLVASWRRTASEDWTECFFDPGPESGHAEDRAVLRGDRSLITLTSPRRFEMYATECGARSTIAVVHGATPSPLKNVLVGSGARPIVIDFKGGRTRVTQPSTSRLRLGQPCPEGDPPTESAELQSRTWCR